MNTDDLIRKLATDARPVRRQLPVGVLLVIWLATSIIPVAGCMFACGARPDFAEAIRQPALLCQLAALTAVAILSATAAIRLSIPGCERSTASRRAAAVLVVLWIAALIAATFGRHACEAGPGAPCSLDVALVTILPCAVLAWICRTALPLRPAVTGALIFAASASIGAASSLLVCPGNDPLHLLTWHAAPVLILIIAGLAAGKILLHKPPRQP